MQIIVLVSVFRCCKSCRKGDYCISHWLLTTTSCVVELQARSKPQYLLRLTWARREGWRGGDTLILAEAVLEMATQLE